MEVRTNLPNEVIDTIENIIKEYNDDIRTNIGKNESYNVSHAMKTVNMYEQALKVAKQPFSQKESDCLLEELQKIIDFAEQVSQ